MEGKTRSLAVRVVTYAIVFSISFAFVVLSSAAYSQKSKNDPEVQKKSKITVKQQGEEARKLLKEANKEVVLGLSKVTEAIVALDEGKNEEALKLLKEAVGSFDIALAAKPDLGFVPVSSIVQVHEFYSHPDIVKVGLEEVKDLLKKGNVQEARVLLSGMRSDVSIVSNELPMATYPAAIRLAVKQLVDGKIEEAKGTLATAMNTVVKTEKLVSAIPLTTARDLIDESSKMDKLKEKSKILKNLEMAKDQLEVARLLGYKFLDKRKYEETDKDIKELMDKVKGDNKVEAIYKSLKKRFSDWFD